MSLKTMAYQIIAQSDITIVKSYNLILCYCFIEITNVTIVFTPLPTFGWRGIVTALSMPQHYHYN